MSIKLIVSDGKDLKALSGKLGMRAKMDDTAVMESVREILDSVRSEGDNAVCRYTEKFDKVKLGPAAIKVTNEEIEGAFSLVDGSLIEVIERARDNILEFHLAQKTEDVVINRNDSYIKLISRPLDTVGIYVPGGTAPLPSSVLMNILPAKAAGVRRIIMCTPPARDGNVDPVILAAAKIAGADEIYKIGGAQAIAAMAYGTETVPKTDKICGPGNIYVNTAKRMLYGVVDIDMFAGPSEILILADETARPEFLAADLLSQAEHDKLASAILITDSRDIAEKTISAVEEIMKDIPRKEILEASLRDYGAVVLVPDMDFGIRFANDLSPEHLELCVRDPEGVLPEIKNAGAVFLGNYSPESLGDYYAGPNHVLPTSGTARFFSPLNTGDFIKKISVINYTEEEFKKCSRDIALFARSEKLECHARAAEVRRKDG